MNAPALSVVVTVVDGGEALERCLKGLLSQSNPPCCEILVPYDSTVDVTQAIRRQFTGVRFLDLGVPAVAGAGLNPRVHHELAERRRAAGMAAASAALIALIEDRMVPQPEWTAAAVRLHHERPEAGIGGAIVNGRPRVLNWADYFADYGNYEPPFDPGPRAQLSDVNACYKREPLFRIEELWRDRHYEAAVQAEFVKVGAGLFLTPQMVVAVDRGALRLGDLLRERLAWGRLYGEYRARGNPTMRYRLLLAAAAPLVPLILFARTVRQRLGRRASLLPFLAAAPIVFLLCCAWGAGEASAYLRLSRSAAS